jgi:cyclopropane fatty-acyl-phospholipid synthase-like methyltransferase
MMNDFTKQFFQKAWGETGYYETFSYGVGINRVCEVALNPFFNPDHHALEIGSGGGAFTERMVGKFKHLHAVDVIRMPDQFKDYENFIYIELPDKSYDLKPIANATIDFCFSYNVFCHLSNEALKSYLKAVHRVLKPHGNFVFMLSNYKHASKHFEERTFDLGDLLPMGHFYQDHRTLPLIADMSKWEVVSPDLIPEHRDIIIHLRRK